MRCSKKSVPHLRSEVQPRDSHEEPHEDPRQRADESNLFGYKMWKEIRWRKSMESSLRYRPQNPSEQIQFLQAKVKIRWGAQCDESHSSINWILRLWSSKNGSIKFWIFSMQGNYVNVAWNGWTIRHWGNCNLVSESLKIVSKVIKVESTWWWCYPCCQSKIKLIIHIQNNCSHFIWISDEIDCEFSVFMNLKRTKYTIGT